MKCINLKSDYWLWMLMGHLQMVKYTQGLKVKFLKHFMLRMDTALRIYYHFITLHQ